VEHWRWKEYRWHDESLDWKQADVISSGVDVGSVSAQATILLDGRLYALSNQRTGFDSPESANKAIDWAMEGTGMTLNDVHYKVGTGYGRVNVPFADKTVTEIACHARGGNMMFGDTVRTILDMGGQDCKAIRCDEKGKVEAFLKNDKCAAGTGRGMEVFADLMSIPIEEMGDVSLTVEEEPEPVSSTCVVFAKSEATGLLRQGWPKNKVVAAYCSAMAHCVVGLLQRLDVVEDFAVTGGIGKNRGIVERIEGELGLTALESDYDSQIAGALGAALFGQALEKKRRAGRSG
jgi:bzd-type benzoyl-CoA reductase Q subunit